MDCFVNTDNRYFKIGKILASKMLPKNWQFFLKKDEHATKKSQHLNWLISTVNQLVLMF